MRVIAGSPSRTATRIGDAWFSCELSVPTGTAADVPALTDRLGRWCAGVLLAEPTEG